MKVAEVSGMGPPKDMCLLLLQTIRIDWKGRAYLRQGRLVGTVMQKHTSTDQGEMKETGGGAEVEIVNDVTPIIVIESVGIEIMLIRGKYEAIEGTGDQLLGQGREVGMERDGVVMIQGSARVEALRLEDLATTMTTHTIGVMIAGVTEIDLVLIGFFSHTSIRITAAFDRLQKRQLTAIDTQYRKPPVHACF